MVEEWHGLIQVHTGDYLYAANFVEAIQTRQGLYVACIEEIAYRNGSINRNQLLKLSEPLMKTEYGKYLVQIADEEIQ